MRNDAITEAPSAHHPPVVDKSGEEADIPIRAVLGSEQDGCEHHRAARVAAEGDRPEVVMDEPAHEPRTPEQFLNDRDENYGSYYAADEHEWIVNEIVCDRASYFTGNAVLKKPMTAVSRPQDVRCNPERENRDTNENAATELLDPEAYDGSRESPQNGGEQSDADADRVAGARRQPLPSPRRYCGWH